MQAVEDREDGAVEIFLGFEVGVGQRLYFRLEELESDVPGIGAYLSVRSHILKKTRNTTEGLIKVGALAQWVGDGLEDLLVLLCVGLVHLLGGFDVVLEVADGVLPCSQALLEKGRGL